MPSLFLQPLRDGRSHPYMCRLLRMKSCQLEAWPSQQSASASTATEVQAHSCHGGGGPIQTCECCILLHYLCNLSILQSFYSDTLLPWMYSLACHNSRPEV
jgi:hypothetical protein